MTIYSKGISKESKLYVNLSTEEEGLRIRFNLAAGPFFLFWGEQALNVLT